MPLYVTLANWTDQGARDVKDSVKRGEAFVAGAERMGCKVHQLVWTMGPHDIVAIIEAPNDAVFSSLALGLGKLGNVRGLSMRAFTKEEMGKITQAIP
ncbi:MAG TPA: GYD domain-containing protein [bacterium]|nr:GYD domain-containing protein [bacterium]